jgi:hypothetical protein
MASGQSLFRYGGFLSCRGFDLLHNYLTTPAFCSRIASLMQARPGRDHPR